MDTTNYLINTENYKIPQDFDTNKIPDLSRGARIAFHSYVEEISDEHKKDIGAERPTVEVGHHKYNGNMVKNNERYPTSLKERITTLKSLKEELTILKKDAWPENRRCFLKILLTTAIVAVLVLSGYGFVTDLVTVLGKHEAFPWFAFYLFPAMLSIPVLVGVNIWHVQKIFCKIEVPCETKCCVRNTLAVIAATIFPPLAIALPIIERVYKAKKLAKDIQENEKLVIKTLDTYKKLIEEDKVKEKVIDARNKIEKKMQEASESHTKTIQENEESQTKIEDQKKLERVTGQTELNNLIEAYNTIIDLEKFFEVIGPQK